MFTGMSILSMFEIAFWLTRFLFAKFKHVGRVQDEQEKEKKDAQKKDLKKMMLENKVAAAPEVDKPGEGENWVSTISK